MTERKIKMIGIRLGNLTVVDLERELGIKFSDEDREYLKATRQENVSRKLAAESWHFFDLPRTLSFGSIKFGMKITKLIKNYNPQGSITCDYQLDEETELPKNFYNLKTESGYPRFLFSVSKYLPIDAYNSYAYFQLVKENKKSLVYRMTESMRFEKDVLEFDQFILHETLVPKENVFLHREIKINKEIFDNLPNDKIVYAGYEKYGSMIHASTLTYLRPWYGEMHKDTIDKEDEQAFIKKMNNHKQYLKELKKREK